MRGAIYPGSFDPLTLGHLDLIRRGCRLFGSVLVAIGSNSSKRPWLEVPRRVALIREVLAAEQLDAEVTSFEGLLVDLARARGIEVILRGVRSAADLAEETAMAQTNGRLSPGLETVFLAPSPATSFLSSHLVREIIAGGGDVSELVPPAVQAEVAAARARSGD